MVTKTAAPKINASDFPELVAARNRFAKVQQAHDANKRETQSIIHELNGNANSTFYQRQLDGAAEKLLQDGEVSALADITTELNNSLRQKWKEAEVLSRALEMAERQMEDARSKACRELAVKIEPQYRQVLAQMKAAILALRAAAIAEAKFRDEFEQAGFGAVFGSYVRPMPYAGAGYVESGGDNDTVGLLDSWLVELKTNFPGV
jgi:hypothetical protein